MHHAGRRDGQLRYRGRDLLAQEGEGVAEDRVVDADAAGVLHARRLVDDRAGVAAPRRLALARDMADALELVDEVHVPLVAAQLAVRRAAQADVLLEADGGGDR